MKKNKALRKISGATLTLPKCCVAGLRKLSEGFQISRVTVQTERGDFATHETHL